MRLIQSIFSGGKTGATGSGGFTDEELADYQKALMRGRQATGAGGNPVLGAAGGLLGQMARKKFFPTDEEESNKVVKQAMQDVMASGISPNDSLNFQRAVIGQLQAYASQSDNPALIAQVVESSQKLKETEAATTASQNKRVQDELGIAQAKENLIQTKKQNIINDAEQLRKTTQQATNARGKFVIGSEKSRDYLNTQSNEFKKYYQDNYNAVGKLTALMSLGTDLSGADDYIFTSSLVKAIDDGVMTDSEAIMAGNTAGDWARIKNLLDKFKKGQNLPAEARASILRTLANVTKGKQGSFEKFFNATINRTSAAFDMDSPEQKEAVKSLMLQYFGTPQELYDTDSEKFFNDALKRAEEIESKKPATETGETSVLDDIVRGAKNLLGYGDEEKLSPATEEEEEKKDDENLFNF